MHFFLNDAKKQHMFVETGLYEAVGSLPVKSSLLPQALFVVSFLKTYSRSDWFFFLFILKVANIRCFILIKCSEQEARFKKYAIIRG
jgi:hypothetical protein